MNIWTSECIASGCADDDKYNYTFTTVLQNLRCWNELFQSGLSLFPFLEKASGRSANDSVNAIRFIDMVAWVRNGRLKGCGVVKSRETWIW